MMRILLFSVLVACMIGVMVPNVFAETNVDYETTLFTDPDGAYTIEFPSDGWSIHPYSGTFPKAMIKDSDGKTTIKISHSKMTRIQEDVRDSEKGQRIGDRQDFTDNEIFEWKYNLYSDKCKEGAYVQGFWWYECYKLDLADKKIGYTNQGEKLRILDLTFTIFDKYYLIYAEMFDGDAIWEIEAITTVKDSKKKYQFDIENLQKIREIIKSFTIPKPDTTPAEIPQTQKIPDWVRNIFIWYGEEQISETEILGAIQFLVQQGIIDLE